VLALLVSVETTLAMFAHAFLIVAALTDALATHHHLG